MDPSFGHADLRWDTRRFKVAAALLVYGFKLCQNQPFIRMRDPAGRRPDGISIWFTPVHPQTEIVQPDCGWFEAQWVDAEKWKAFKLTEHGRPWSFMRAGMEARDYLEKVVVPGGRAAEAPPPDAFRTENLSFAACLCALSFHVYSHRGGVFTFNAKAAQLKAAYENDGDTKHVIRWAKWALIAHDQLVAAINSQKNVPQLGFKKANKVAIISETAPPAIRDPLIRNLYS